MLWGVECNKRASVKSVRAWRNSVCEVKSKIKNWNGMRNKKWIGGSLLL